VADGTTALNPEATAGQAITIVHFDRTSGDAAYAYIRSVGTCLVLPQHVDDLLFHEPPTLHWPTSRSSGRSSKLSENKGFTEVNRSMIAANSPSEIVRKCDELCLFLSNYIILTIFHHLNNSLKIRKRAMVGLLDNLTFDQQSEMIYLGYFNRSADAGGFSFWSGENTKAQTAGQSAPTAVKNIANSFTPQKETLALYPFLSTTSFNPNDAATVTSIGTLVDSIYLNLFGRVSDAGGRAYWVGQITTGAVGIGESVLLIANGATGADAILLQNKINIALDFTTRTNAVGIGLTSAPATLLAAAKSALSVVDGLTLKDASVTAGQAITSVYIDRTSGANVSLGSASSVADATKFSATTNFALAGSGEITINSLSSTQDLNDLTGATVSGKVSVVMASGNSTLNLDLGSTTTTGAAFTFRDTTNNGFTNGIQIAGVSAINIESYGSGTNIVAGFYPASGSSLDGLVATITGSASLVLGNPAGLFNAFGATGSKGVTINAGAFTGSLTYAGSGKGDTVVSGSGSDTFFASTNDKITTGAGADKVILRLGAFGSSTASDVAFITDFTPGTDKIAASTTANSGAHNWFDVTSIGLDTFADLASAAKQAFVGYVVAVGSESFGDVVMFKWKGQTYDAISKDGQFHTTGYADNSGTPKELIVGVNQVTQTKADFLLFG
jgi:hypothetical protein